jgi:hemolysin D
MNSITQPKGLPQTRTGFNANTDSPTDSLSDAIPQKFSAQSFSRESFQRSFQDHAQDYAQKPNTQNPNYQKPNPEATGWSESIQSVLEQPPAALSRYLIILGLGFIGVCGLWAWTGRMQEVSHAQGELIPRGKTYKIQPATAGEIDKILVKEGDPVEKGQLLFELDASLPKSEVVRLEDTLAAAKQRLEQVRSLHTQTQRESLAQLAVADASIQAQRATMDSSQAAAQTSQTLLDSSQSDLAAHQERLSRISTLEAQGAISKEYLFEIEQGVRSQQNSITQTTGDLAQSLAFIRQTEAELAQKRAEAQQVQIAAQQAMQKLTIEAEALEATIADTQTLIAQAKTRLEKSQVRSPSTGIVSSLEIDNTGEMIQSGRTLAEIVPAGMPLILSAIVPQQEAGLIKTGMTTQIKFDAFPYQNYGVMSGTVLSISPDAKGTPETGSGYQVNIALAKNHVMHEQKPIPLHVGQTASAEIVVRQRRVIDLVLDPIRRLQATEINL